MDKLTIIFVAIAAIFFVTIIVGLLIIVDHKARMRNGKSSDIWSIQGQRDGHPIWAWFVSMFLWSIWAMLIIGIVARIGFGDGKVHAEKKEHKAVAGSELLKLVEEESIFDKKAHFHNLVKDYTEEGNQPVCYYCHGNYPHKKQKMIRSLLNMHTQFIGCMTCHLDGIPENDITLKWSNYSGVQPKGKPFGISYDPKTGALAKTDDYYSKISAFSDSRMLEIPEDEPDARDFIKIRGQLTPSEQAKIKARFHKNVGAKGRFCTKCHRTEEGYVPFKELGFSEQRINDLTGLNVVSITEKYKEFYMPGIFKDTNISPEKAQELLGKGAEKTITEGLTDPSVWWRKKFTAPQAATPEDAPFAGTPAKK